MKTTEVIYGFYDMIHDRKIRIPFTIWQLWSHIHTKLPITSNSSFIYYLLCQFHEWYIGCVNFLLNSMIIV